MLVTRQPDTWHTWSPIGTLGNDSRSRMSHQDGLTAQRDWREQYSQYLPQIDTGVLTPPLEQTISSHSIDAPITQKLFAPRPPLGHRRSLAQPDKRSDTVQAHSIERPDSTQEDVGNTSLTALQTDSDGTTQSGRSDTSASMSPSLQVKTDLDSDAGLHRLALKEDEEDDDDEDDDMLDMEDIGTGNPQTEAERRAERRKMKRFRLTHQQTRFLMSEFAKQAHPDAAHRERLSREIPGLSPRQVQVWFQNRRAKIKRLTADDRDRMMKMRAVPDDFDNVQALHSPYGAVHGIGAPLQSPIDYTPVYGDHGMMRPLMVDTMRRHDSDEHLSSTGLSPAFGNVSFGPSGTVTTPDISPLSVHTSDRYYSSHMSTPLSTGPQHASFSRQNSGDNYQLQSHSRSQSRSLQPLHFRESVSRPRSESLRSPLRSSMSWKGDSLDYASYNIGQGSPGLTGRQQSMYQAEQTGDNSSNGQQYDGGNYSNSSVLASPYPTSQPAPHHALPAQVSRFRASSSAYPPNLELRTQLKHYRSISSQHSSNAPSTSRTTSFASAFSTGGFQSAPLIAPADFQVPRTPIEAQHTARESYMSQLSAPMAPPHDFTAAYRQSTSPGRTSPVAEQSLRSLQADHSHMLEHQPSSDSSYGFESGTSAHKRKRTFSMSRTFEGQ